MQCSIHFILLFYYFTDIQYYIILYCTVDYLEHVYTSLLRSSGILTKSQCSQNYIAHVNHYEEYFGSLDGSNVKEEKICDGYNLLLTEKYEIYYIYIFIYLFILFIYLLLLLLFIVG